MKYYLRIPVIGLIMMIGCSALLARLWWVQIEHGSIYAERVPGESRAKVRVPSVRGEIRDRNGVTLVENRASYQVDFYLPDVVAGYRAKHGKVPTRDIEVTIDGFPATKTETDIVKVVREGIIDRLEELGLAVDFNADRLRRHWRGDTHVPFTYIDDLDFETLARFAENDLGLPGVKLDTKPVRSYRYDALGGHLLGYVGDTKDISSQPDINEFDFYEPDPEGKSNVEKFMDPYLRGKPGVRILKRDAKGVIRGELGMEPPTPGANVYLTIDARIQAITERALRAVGRGAAVVIDPNTGDILAMASVPSYDPNLFVPRISTSDWSQLRDDPTHPLLNRAISGYAPGSTYKTMIGLAGLVAGLDPNRRAYNCVGGVHYGNKFMRCLGTHGALTLSDAIKRSCNSYFYQFGNAAGIDNIVKVGNLIGMGQKSGIELSGEKPGIMPGPEWLATVNPRERWRPGLTANVAIGQGAVLASPLQMAMLTATIANGGVVYQPRLVDKIVDHKNQVIVKDPPKVRGHLAQLGLTPDQIEEVREGMWKVVNESGGTARRARLERATVAGKTGTAQNWTIRDGKKIQENHAWFISFAPYKDPKLAVAVFVQGAKSGGGVGAPIAAKILDEALAIEQGFNPPVKPMEPAIGNIRFVNGVDFSSSVPADLGAEPEGEAVAGPEPDPVTTSETTITQSTEIRPAIREAADDEGRVQNVESDQRPSFFQRLLEGDNNQESRPASSRRFKR